MSGDVREFRGSSAVQEPEVRDDTPTTTILAGTCIRNGASPVDGDFTFQIYSEDKLSLQGVCARKPACNPQCGLAERRSVLRIGQGDDRRVKVMHTG